LQEDGLPIRQGSEVHRVRICAGIPVLSRGFADGLFVPEREVLSIEALRSLGRSAEAISRLQQFKAQYPNSFHLRRLQR
jgi:hypothetical protein